MATKALLDVQHLKTYFQTDDGLVKAVDDVSFQVNKGETLGVVGESGCGKSVTALSIMQLVPQAKGKIVGGAILYARDDGRVVDIAALHPRGSAIRDIRGNEIAMIFQEPMVSLSPVHSIGFQIIEAIRLHQRTTKEQARQHAIEMLQRVGIPSASKRIDGYPHEFSGGMRQRVMIAMALSCNPNILIADEPTTALDVTIEAQILELMKGIQRDFDMSIILITHDLGVIRAIANNVMVMYLGKSVESGSVDQILHHANHPYTKGLLQSIPQIGLRQKLVPIRGSVPNMRSLPQGCYFCTRCANATDVCRSEQPPIIETSSGHCTACWLYA